MALATYEKFGGKSAVKVKVLSFSVGEQPIAKARQTPTATGRKYRVIK
jgi:hypothetical protein